MSELPYISWISLILILSACYRYISAIVALTLLPLSYPLSSRSTSRVLNSIGSSQCGLAGPSLSTYAKIPTPPVPAHSAFFIRPLLKAANEAIANVTQAAEYAVYQTALHSLAAAQQSTTSLKGLQLAQDKTQEGEDAVLNTTKMRPGITIGMQAVQLKNHHSGSSTTGRSSAIS